MLLFFIVLYKGYKEGMLLQIVNLVNTFVALIIAWLFSDVFVEVYQFVSYTKTGYLHLDQFFSKHANRMIWFVVLFVLIRVVLMLLKPIASAISKLPLVKQVNSIAGALFSIVSYFVYLLIMIFILTLPIVKNGSEIIDNSFLGQVETVVQPALGFIEETIQTNTSIQYILSEKELSLSQKQSIVNFLSENGFSNDEIREFLLKYHE